MVEFFTVFRKQKNTDIIICSAIITSYAHAKLTATIPAHLTLEHGACNAKVIHLIPREYEDGYKCIPWMQCNSHKSTCKLDKSICPAYACLSLLLVPLQMSVYITGSYFHIISHFKLDWLSTCQRNDSGSWKALYMTALLKRMMTNIMKYWLIVKSFILKVKDYIRLLKPLSTLCKPPWVNNLQCGDWFEETKMKNTLVRQHWSRKLCLNMYWTWHWKLQYIANGTKEHVKTHA